MVDHTEPARCDAPDSFGRETVVGKGTQAFQRPYASLGVEQIDVQDSVEPLFRDVAKQLADEHKPWELVKGDEIANTCDNLNWQLAG